MKIVTTLIIAVIAFFLSGGNFFLFMVFGFIGYIIVKIDEDYAVRKKPLEDWEIDI